MLNAFRSGLQQYGSGVIAMTNELIPLERDPFSGVKRTVQSQPFLFALAGVERRRRAEFVCHGDDKMLLFRKWERFEWAENTGLVHDFQLPGHGLIVPCRRVSPPLLALDTEKKKIADVCACFLRIFWRGAAADVHGERRRHSSCVKCVVR